MLLGRYLGFLTFFSTLIPGKAGICYYPNGVLAPLQVPCRATKDGGAFCCPPGWSCLDNKLCAKLLQNGQQNYTRATCTDPTFQSEQCPQFCLQQPWTNNPMTWCGQSHPLTYCCTSDSPCDCKTHANGVQLFAPNTTISVIPTATPTSLDSNVQSNSPVSSASSTASSTSSTSSSGAQLATASMASSSTSAVAQGSSSINTTAIAVGVVVPVVVIALLIGAYLWYRQKWNFGPAAQGKPEIVEADGTSRMNPNAYTQQNEKLNQIATPRSELGNHDHAVEMGRFTPVERHELNG